MPSWISDTTRSLWLACGMLGVLAWVGLSQINLPQDSAFSLCFIRRLFGLSCPGCGLTRAFGFLAQGLWEEAFRMHPLALLLALEAALFWIYWGLVREGRCRPLSDSTVRRGAWLHLVILLSVWAARLLTGTLPDQG